MQQNKNSQQQISDEELGRKIGERIVEIIRAEDAAPLTACIVGQTGVGKSSLLNALFGCRLAINHVEPQTKVPEAVPYTAPNGRQLLFYDLPGFGESAEMDVTYIKMYVDAIRRSDIVLWGFHCDSRSVLFDRTGLHRVLEVGFNSCEEQDEVLSKLVPVLTKADQIQIRPWTFAIRNLNRQRFLSSTRMNEDSEGMFVPDAETEKVLEEKEQYFFKEFIAPIGDRITIKTFNDSKFSLPPDVVDKSILADESHVRHRGVVDHERFKELVSNYPSHKEIFARLHEGSSVVSCSSLFRFNLNRLMAVVLSRTATSAAGRIDGALSTQRWSTLRLSEARNLSNFRIFDISTRRFVFDLQKEVLR